MLTLCFLAVLALLATTAGGLYVDIKHNRQSSIISQGFIDFFCAQDESGITDFDKSLNNLAQVTADKQAAMIVASMRGTKSAAIKATMSGLEEEAIASDPESAMEAAIAAALPAKIQKNEMAKIGMTNFIKKILTGGLQKGNTGGGNHSADPLNLKMF